MHPDLLRARLGELRLGVTVEARIVGRILRIGEGFAIAIEGTAIGLYVWTIVARVGRTLQMRGAISEAQVILHRA